VRARSDMAALTAAGLVASFGLQAFVIIGGVSRLIPLTGITLPFVSYGGSSVVSNFVLLGLLMRAGDDSAEDGSETISAGRTGTLGRVALASRLTRVAWLVAALVTALVANLTYVQIVAAPALAANPSNTRNLEKELRAERGAILTRDGKVLAQSVATGTRFTRTYPSGSLAAHVVGYYSARYGRAGIEAAQNDVLAGHRAFTDWQAAMDEALGRPAAGSDIVLTIDSRVQAAAEKALAGQRGACVAIDPRTGAVLALASSPAYDPGRVEAQWDTLSKGAAAPLVDRATSSLYPPGSTFKVVTLTGALASGIAAPGTVYPAPAVLEIGGGKVTNFEGEGGGSATLAHATASSINTVFAQVADQLGAERLVASARGFGFDAPVPFELNVQASLMPDPGTMTKWETAWAGVGQPVGASAVKGPIATPFEMALVAAGIANGGQVMEPRLIERVTDSSGKATLQMKGPTVWTKACDPAVAAMVRDLMVQVVKSGSGTRASIKGVQVAGKTGTAEVGKSLPTHAWFIAFAPAENPTVAVAIVLENAGVGGRVAAPAAKPVLEAALKVQR
jgi:cell division protein FtsI/penicillin-binding protein 2